MTMSRPPLVFAVPPSPQKRHGYTVAELLVVLAVLLLFATLIGSVLSNWREQAQAVQCLGNLRELGMAHRLWRQERNDRLWDHSVQDIRPSLMLYQTGALMSAKGMQCPAATRTEEGAWLDYPASGGMNGPYYLEFKRVPISYGANRYAFSVGYLYAFGVHDTLKIYLAEERRYPVLMDATLWNIDQSSWNDFTSRSRIALRHGGRAQVLFLDGHVEALDHQGVLALSPVGSARARY